MDRRLGHGSKDSSTTLHEKTPERTNRRIQILAEREEAFRKKGSQRGAQPHGKQSGEKRGGVHESRGTAVEDCDRTEKFDQNSAEETKEVATNKKSRP